MSDSVFEDVLAFWFAGTEHDPVRAQERHDFWFEADRQADALIAQRYSAVLRDAKAGALQAWEGRPRSALALVIVLDQFPRNMHRGTPAAFECDTRALGATKRAIAAGYLAALTTPEQTFLLMPYQHVEDAAVQREGVGLFEAMVNEARPEWRAFAGGILDYARMHLDIVERFGRFPHRNAVLARDSTAAEREFLESNGESFGQGKS